MGMLIASTRFQDLVVLVIETVLEREETGLNLVTMLLP